MNPESPFSPKLWQEIQTKRSVRVKLARESVYNFAHIYFPDYFEYQTAPFQQQMYAMLEDPSIRHLGIVSFRGSGKSSIVTTFFLMWAILGKQEKKYALIASQTQVQARKHLANAKQEFDSNELLRNDFGPLKETSDEWGSMSLVLPKYGARISAVSSEQSIRGTRHGSHRPDLVIADDVEDLQSVKTSEGREKTFDWYTSEILPVGDQSTKFVLIGNLLHTDSLMMRMKAFSERQPERFVFKEYPLINDAGVCIWPGKYPTPEAVEREKKEAPSERAYYREYLLKILPDNMQIVKPENITYYEAIPPQLVGGSYRIAICVDLAISKKTSADYTAIVVMEKHGYGKDAKIYVYPYPINKRNLYSETVKDIVSLKSRHTSADIYIEDVGMQRAIIEMLSQENMRAEAIPLNGRDKEERLQVASFWILNGTVQFPQEGCKKLLQQVIGFGVERDDLLDALTLGIIYMMEQKNNIPGFHTGPVKGSVFDRSPRTRSRRYNVATASDDEFFGSSTGFYL
ncbi:MAG TPA: hypothetical protein PKB09_02520 [Candidatus Saccharibacteria bacterium]|nr:hypothetical protein [Candidatus Saccharibacteria bacterium]